MDRKHSPWKTFANRNPEVSSVNPRSAYAERPKDNEQRKMGPVPIDGRKSSMEFEMVDYPNLLLGLSPTAPILTNPGYPPGLFHYDHSSPRSEDVKRTTPIVGKAEVVHIGRAKIREISITRQVRTEKGLARYDRTGSPSDRSRMHRKASELEDDWVFVEKNKSA
ncbi:hypothetical protein SCARD494_03501 [Seiridium cardinale]